MSVTHEGGPADPIDPAAEHGDTPDEVDTAELEKADPLHDPAEAQVDDILGGHEPLR